MFYRLVITEERNRLVLGLKRVTLATLNVKIEYLKIKRRINRIKKIITLWKQVEDEVASCREYPWSYLINRGM